MLSPLKISLSYDRRVSGAAQQNGVPLVRLLQLRNVGPVDLWDLEVRLWAEPDLGERWSGRVNRIAVGDTHSIPRIALPLDPERLVNMTELEEGRLGLAVLAGERVLHEETHPLALLAYNEWPGLCTLPELLAAYVLPNHPDVVPVLGAARDHLERWTRDGALNGYDARDPIRVRQVVAAVYAAVQSLGISYVRPPASFEAEGQKVRTPELVMATRMGTCLDLSLLAAAALEQAGLRPLLFLQRGHAFAGCWLVPEHLPSPATDDADLITRRVGRGEVCVFDPTVATKRPPISFEDAEATASAHLEKTELFEYAIDVEGARRAAIRPLPSRIRDQGFEVASAADHTAAAPAPAPVEHVGPLASGVSQSAMPADAGPRRLQQWKTALLDLSLRNRLLNFRETKRSVRLLLPKVGDLEDVLAAGREAEVLARPWMVSGERSEDRPPASPTPLPDPEDDAALTAYLNKELAGGRIYADIGAGELERRLINISRGARNAQQEGGVSTLFLALGQLAWYDSKTPEVQRRAPVLLLPLELTRERAGARFRLRLADDEARLNPTLMELLRTDHAIDLPSLTTLPSDTSGLNVGLILGELSHAIGKLQGWEVLEEAYVGLFSFTKFLMWNDLEQHAPTLLDNPVVRHLVAEGGDEEPPWAHTRFGNPRDLDADHAPGDTYCPLNADASQLSAIFAAAGGHSFVLEGPPGTGKSQTITNLIAHSLATGRTVLFVSQKLAALEVVHKRLDQVGLAPFCLELHSNKSKKREVIEQFAQALNTAGAPFPDSWNRQADGLAELRGELNHYAEALHRPRPLGRSVFEVTARLLTLRHAERVRFERDPVAATTQEQLADLDQAVDRLAVAARPLGSVVDHPWRPVRRGGWEPELEPRVEEALDRLEPTLAKVDAASAGVRERLHLDDVPRTRTNERSLVALSRLLTDSPAPTMALLDAPGWADRQRRVASWIDHGRQRSSLWRPLRDTYSSALLALPLAQLAARFGRWTGAFFLLAWIMLWTARRTLKAVSRLGSIPPSRHIGSHLSAAQHINAQDVHLKNAAVEGEALFGHRWRGVDSDWSELEEVVTWCARFRSHLAILTDGLPAQSAEAVRARLLRLACEETDQATSDHPTGKALARLSDAQDTFDARRGDLVALLTLDTDLAWGEPDAPDHLSWLGERLATWRAALPGLRQWCLYRGAANEAGAQGLQPLLHALETGQVDAEGLTDCFDRSFHRAWLDAVTTAEPALRDFHTPGHERQISRFRDLDEELLGLVQKESHARLADSVPDPGQGAVAGSELSVLLREIQKKRRHLPVRQLFAQIPGLVPKLKPCVLMSPLSIAQYLDPALPPFDLVVFDEASQIPVWDAIGAIARGRQVLVVGDSRQLPPTNFFGRADSEDDPSDDDFGELESILDECVAAGLPRCRLRWHYRSRHEHLIAFSNLHYYDGNLLTFPAARTDPKRLGLRWIPVDGIYDKGRTRTNRAEAEAVVAEILRRLQDPADRERSIGVVTFSQPQQTLIENLLEEARRAHPEIDPFFRDDRPEPVFVKNLENVQGDERDVMMFSICYAKDRQGKISMHFGPLNRTGGERRLNVAVTRAREQLLVFSTLRPEHMNLTKTRAVGVHHLHAFLRYAAGGPGALSESFAQRVPHDPVDPVDDPLVADLHATLQARGWALAPGVSCSGARVDLAVTDPASPDGYLLGIEGDGLVYRQGETARDRDSLRPAVLERLGWRIHRVWSVDWFRSREAELARLDQALANAREDVLRTTEAPLTAATTATKPGTAAPPPDRIAAGAPASPQTPGPSAVERVADLASRAHQATLPGSSGYIPANLEVVGEPEAFEAPVATGQIQELLRQLLTAESPISLERLVHGVTDCWQISRVTGRIRQRVLGLIDDRQAHRVQDFFWSTDQDPDRYTEIRTPTEDPRSERAAEDIPHQELANAMAALVAQNINLPTEELFKSTARVFGISRVGNRVRAQLDVALTLLADTGRARRQNDRVALPPDE
jgi:uncharacterized protein DUF4011/restriction endonuclease-like protein/AAA domain-containing protein/uncharacterized protein DUF3320